MYCSNSGYFGNTSGPMDRDILLAYLNVTFITVQGFSNNKC